MNLRGYTMKRNLSILFLITLMIETNSSIAQTSKVFHAFYYPKALVIDSKGNLFVTGKNNKVIKITPDGKVADFAGNTNGNSGNTDGYGTNAMFESTEGIAIDRSDNLYVADNKRVRKITPDGLVSTVAGNSTSKQVDGFGQKASFYRVSNITIDKNESLFITDETVEKNGKDLVSMHTIRRISRDGVVTTLKNTDGLPIKIGFAGGIACDSDGNLVVCDQRSRCIKKISVTGAVNTIAGKCDFQKWNPTYKEGNVTSALLVEPSAIVISKKGEIIFSDLRMHRIIKVANAKVTTIAGNGEIDLSHSNIGGYAEEGYADGNAKAALFNAPQGIAFDKEGNLFIVDSNNKCIRMLSTSGRVSTVSK